MRYLIIPLALIFFLSCKRMTEETDLQMENVPVADYGWHFSEDSVRECAWIVLYSDLMKLGYRPNEIEDKELAFELLQKSEVFLDSLILYNPKLNHSLYTNGKMIYNRLIRLSGDPEQKARYAKKLENLEIMEKTYF
jgi:hypothetical protein